jgi:hypothetical protein
VAASRIHKRAVKPLRFTDLYLDPGHCLGLGPWSRRNDDCFRAPGGGPSDRESANTWPLRKLETPRSLEPGRLVLHLNEGYSAELVPEGKLTPFVRIIEPPLATNSWPGGGAGCANAMQIP